VRREEEESKMKEEKEQEDGAEWKMLKMNRVRWKKGKSKRMELSRRGRIEKEVKKLHKRKWGKSAIGRSRKGEEKVEEVAE
jgi:hypothetical protein